jgi:hypothetical protein
MNEQTEFNNIGFAYSYLITAFELLNNADLFDKLCENVSVRYDEYMEEIEKEDQEEYAQSILELCLTGI